jgi:hypothetical protein
MTTDLEELREWLFRMSKETEVKRGGIGGKVTLITNKSTEFSTHAARWLKALDEALGVKVDRDP